MALLAILPQLRAPGEARLLPKLLGERRCREKFPGQENDLAYEPRDDIAGGRQAT
jgi:hypothetical protein